MHHCNNKSEIYYCGTQVYLLLQIKKMTGCLDLKVKLVELEVAFRPVFPLCKCCAVGKSVNVNFFIHGLNVQENKTDICYFLQYISIKL